MSSNNLKAWVRYDGKGKIVPSSLILQTNKPKVGTWKEISTDLCCPICPYTLNCTLYQNIGGDIGTIEGVACGENFSADHDVNPGETICMQVVISQSGSFSTIGNCGCL